MNDASSAPRATEPFAAAVPPPSLSGLFIAFAIIALCGFGGVLAWSRRMMVDERRWLTPEQFNETYALCSFLPGPNIVNFSVPMVLITIIGALYAHYGDIPALRRMLVAIAAAAAGLMMATAAKMARPLFRDGAIAGPLIGLATFVSIGIVHWPLPLVLIVLLPLSIALAWMRR